MTDPLRFLFLGNSYTYYNDLPGLVRALGAAAGVRIETAAHTHGGMSLQGQLDGGRALELVRAGGWDAVVLQDQSLRPVRAPALTRIAARRLHAEIAAVGARTVFYLTWARRGQPDQQAVLDHTYYSTARELGAEVAPVGPAWQRAMTARPDVQLYCPDGSHPAPAGSYVAAAVLFARLTGRTPVGLSATTVQAGGDGPLSPIELPAKDATDLQGVAWDALSAAPDPAAWPRDDLRDGALATAPDVALLQETGLLYGLTEAEIGGLLAVTPQRRVPAGTRLCAAGDRDGTAYILLDGKVAEISTHGKSIHNPGHLGLALTLGRDGLTGGAHGATLQAVTEVTVLPIRRADLDALAARSPAAADTLRRNVAPAG